MALRERVPRLPRFLGLHPKRISAMEHHSTTHKHSPFRHEAMETRTGTLLPRSSIDTDSDDTPIPSPSAKPIHVSPTLVVQPPLSRRGFGPGLIILVDESLPLTANPKSLDPPPLTKWAEEGYSVAQITTNAIQSGFDAALQGAIYALVSLPECKDDKATKIGFIAYVPLNYHSAGVIGREEKIAGVLSYGCSIDGLDRLVLLKKPQLAHLAGDFNWEVSIEEEFDEARNEITTTYQYPEVKSAGFVIPAHRDFDVASAGISHTRSLIFLKKYMGGPNFDLEAIWNEHCEYEFGTREVENTMGTMVQEPYVNHIPTLTGGVGRDKLMHFYQNHFIFNNPSDTGLEMISRTIGIDRVIDEFIFSCTHDRMIDWLLPGIPPTGKEIKIPFTSVVNIRGDRLFHEHIAWDQLTALIQLGLIPDYLPFPYPVDGKHPAPGKRFEYRVPGAGVQSAQKLKDENSVQSNEMFGFEIREVDDV